METTLARLEALARHASQDQTARAGTAELLSADAFEEIVRQHQRRIYRVLLGLVRDPDVADTLTQECFLRAYRNRRSFRGEASVGTWLVRIAVNLARDHGRNRKAALWRRLLGGASREESEARVREAEQLPDPQASPERQLAAREQLEDVWSAVEDLSPQQRAVFLLRFGEDMTLEEVAQAMALEVGTVKAHLARALAALRKRLKENGTHASTSHR